MRGPDEGRTGKGEGTGVERALATGASRKRQALGRKLQTPNFKPQASSQTFLIKIPHFDVIFAQTISIEKSSTINSGRL
jgi:hypothetical protein